MCGEIISKILDMDRQFEYYQGTSFGKKSFGSCRLVTMSHRITDIISAGPNKSTRMRDQISLSALKQNKKFQRHHTKYLSLPKGQPTGP